MGLVKTATPDIFWMPIRNAPQLIFSVNSFTLKMDSAPVAIPDIP